MLDEKDIQKLVSVFPTREEIVSKTDFEALRQDFSHLQSAIDAYTKKADAYFQEMLMLAHKVDRLERWITELAKKVGMNLEY
jgi:hypothetical protein